MWKFIHKLGSPPHFYRISTTLTPYFGWAAAILIPLGAYGGLFVAPADYQQLDGFRIIYFHVPSASLSMMAYVTMAISAGVGLIWRIKLAHAVAVACAPIGASFTFLALATGSNGIFPSCTGLKRSSAISILSNLCVSDWPQVIRSIPF